MGKNLFCSILLLLGQLHPATAGPVKRVVSLAPHTTELVVAAGGGSLLLAAVPADKKTDASIIELSLVGGLDREQILTLRPDLVVAWGSGNRASDINWLQQQGIPVYLSEPGTVEQIADDIRALGHLMGTDSEAESSAKAFLSALSNDCARQPLKEVYIDVWDHPAMTIGGRHWLNDALSRVHLRNTFRHIDRPVFSVNRESLLVREHLPHLYLRDGSPLGSALLGRPGPLLAKGLRQLCRQRKKLDHAGITPR